MTRRVLVTGGAGFIGSHTVDALISAGHEVTVVDNLSTGSEANLNPAASFHRADITDAGIAGLLAEIGPEVICHTAAQISVSVGQADPLRDLTVNGAGTLRLLEHARHGGCRFVHVSSAAVYGEPEAIPVTEDHPTRPINNYGVSKLAVELYLAAYARNYGLGYAALRCANVYGPRQNAAGEAGVVAIFCERIARGERPTIDGDGLQTRDFVFVRDVAAASLAATASSATGVFNVGTGIETDVNTLFDAIANALGVSIEPHRGPARQGDIYRSVLDPTRAAEVLGWRAEIDLTRGLQETTRWFLSHSAAE